MEASLDRLERRCKSLIKGSRSYKDTIQGLSTSQLSFADSLEEFCGGTDEESMILGAGFWLIARWLALCANDSFSTGLCMHFLQQNCMLPPFGRLS